MTVASYRKINYSLRPAKHIERKMLADSLRRLGALYPLEGYRYIGFGANTFGDFILFHRLLGIFEMISIESEVIDHDRFELNKPFAAVTMAYGLSGAVLPDLVAGRPTILWLDYDKRLDAPKIGDIELFVGAAVPGSALLITLSAQPETTDGSVLAELEELVGAEVIPPDIAEPDLEGWGFAKACRRIVSNAISDTLRDRNQEIPANEHVRYMEFADFEYSDGMRMMTVGGVLIRPDQEAILIESGLTDLEWYRPSVIPYRIKTPPLTIREMRFLDAQLPCDLTTLNTSGIPTRDATAYASVYRFYPRYVDADY